MSKANARSKRAPWFNKDLAAAVRRGDVIEGAALLRAGANPNAKTNGWTMLRQAVVFGKFGACQMLLKAGAQPDKATAKDRMTPLMEAAFNGHVAICRLLLQHGANLDCKHGSGGTALHFAAQCGHRSICQMLVEHGADMNACACGNETPMDVARGEAFAYLQSVMEQRQLEQCTGFAPKASAPVIRL